MLSKVFIISVLALGILCGCSKDVGPENSGDKIVISAVVNGSKATRASIYKSEAGDLRKDILHTIAYVDNALYFSSDVKYQDQALDESLHGWDFYDAGSSKYVDYFWPLGKSIDMFAYAPLYCGYVSVDNSANPPAFTAIMPTTNSGQGTHQNNMKEFIYAYTPDREKTQGTIPLAFEHPFAAIMFKVSQSHRDLTVKNISINEVAYKGKCTLEWSDDSKRYLPNWSFDGYNVLSLDINKIIPGEVNFGGELGGPYLVLPQGGGITGKQLSVTCHWEGYDDSNEVNADTKTLTATIPEIKWEAGKIYTYTLDLGNSREEILFKVSVKPWEYVFNHEFEIE